MVGVEAADPAAERDLMSGKKCLKREETEDRDEVLRGAGGLTSRCREADDGGGASCFSPWSSSINGGCLVDGVTRCDVVG